MTRRKLAAGNWKMNGLAAAGAELDVLIAASAGTAAEVLIYPNRSSAMLEASPSFMPTQSNPRVIE